MHSLQAADSNAKTPSPAPPNFRMDRNETTPAPQLPSTTDASPNSTFASRNARASKRVKRDSRKKCEARGDDTDDAAPPRRPREKKSTTSASSSAIPSLELRMGIPIPLTDPRPDDVYYPRQRQFGWAVRKTSEVIGKDWEFFEIVDKLSNKNGFRYTYAAEDPKFPRIRYRHTDAPPYHARFSFEDSPTAINFTKDGLGVTTEEPWHSARANICAREGTYYYEARIISGMIPGPEQSARPSRGNVRLGFSRREADLDVNVGVDSYGYGIRDVNGEVVNRMRCRYFLPKGESICEGDVIGMLITLPPLSVQRKIVEGAYNPEIDGDWQSNSELKSTPSPVNFIRDRIPFHLKNDFLWQQSHIFPSKHLRDYAFNLKETPAVAGPSPTNTEDPSLCTLPQSKIVIYKNGVCMGTAFEDLFAFLPPASRATQGSNNMGIGERENADDGMIGYFPTVSCFRGGAVECRFEGPWWCGPPTQDYPDVKPFGERFTEQIAEDVVADIVDEIDAEEHGWSLSDVGAKGPLAKVLTGQETSNSSVASDTSERGERVDSPGFDGNGLAGSAAAAAAAAIAKGSNLAAVEEREDEGSEMGSVQNTTPAPAQKAPEGPDMSKDTEMTM